MMEFYLVAYFIIFCGCFAFK